MRLARLAAFSLVVAFVAGRAMAGGCDEMQPPSPPPPKDPAPPGGDNPANPPPPKSQQPPAPPPADTPPSEGPPSPDAGPSSPSAGPEGGPSTPTDGPNAGPDGPSTGDEGGGAPTSGPPVGPDGGGPTTAGAGRGSGASRDLGSWTYWWTLNRADLVDLAPRGPSTAQTPGARDTKLSVELWREEAHAALAAALQGADAEDTHYLVLALGKARDPLDAMLFSSMLTDAKRPDRIRQAAAVSLGLLADADDMARASSRRALERTCSDAATSPRVRAAALYALGMRRDAESVPLLAKFAAGGAGSWDAPAAAITGLGLSGSSAAREELERLLAAPGSGKSGEMMRRVYAAHGLALLSDRAALPALRTASSDSDPEVRRAAVMALGAVASETDADVVRALVTTMTRDKDRVVRGMAALSLGRIGGDAAGKALVHAHSENDGALRPFVALGLGLVARSSKDESIAKALRKDLAAGQQSELTGALCIALGLAGGSESAAPLRSLVTDSKDAEVRSHAAVALGLLGDTETGAAAVRSLLDVQVPRLQADAALALGLMATSESVPALVAMLEKGSESGTQAAAALSLGRIGGPEAAKNLVAVLKDPSRPQLVRQIAINALGMTLDRQGGRATSMAGAALDWCAVTPTVVDMVRVQ